MSRIPQSWSWWPNRGRAVQSLLDQIINGDAEYQKTIFDAYLQEPMFVPGEEGKAMMQDVVKQFSTLDFKA